MAEYSAGQFVKLMGRELNEKGQGMSKHFFLCVLQEKRRSYTAFQNKFFNTHTLSPSGASCLLIANS